jgi:hypothetical protein
MKQFLARLKILEDKLDKLPSAIMSEVADYLVNASPDDTGAYVLSHSIGQSSAVGRRLDPERRVSAPNTHREEARAKLLGQAASLPPEATRIWVGNNSPHSPFVENGGWRWNTSAYMVYGGLGARWPQFVQQGKAKVGLQ